LSTTSHFESGVPSPGKPGRWKSLALGVLLACAGMSASAQAQQGQSMEERLRAQLRITTSQLQQAQNELAALKAGGTAAGSSAAPAAAPSASAAEVDALKKELAQARAQLRTAQQANARVTEDSEQLRTQAQAATERAAGQVAQFRSAYDELLKLARASEAERQRLASETTLQRTALTQCEAKNTQLYAVGQEILKAYETMDVGSVMASRQPFAAQSRVKFEQIAQQYGDKLYEGRFDARSVTVPAPAPASAPASPQSEPAKSSP
jgi:colicin import membrane protein